MNSGSNQISVTITEGPLTAVVPLDTDPNGGAIVCFEGVVRRLENQQTIEGLHYQAYGPMAERQLHLIAQEVSAQWGLLKLSVEHSVGWVPVGRCSFRLIVISPHRKEAFAAMQEFIDRLKRDVPIWKSVEEPIASQPREFSGSLSRYSGGGLGRGLFPDNAEAPHPSPLPKYRQREQEASRIIPRRFDAVSDSPVDIVTRLAEQCATVATESVAIPQSAGRVLAQSVVADRDHPACDSSAIDGYAILSDRLDVRRQLIAFESHIGQAPRAMPENGVVKIVTGAPIPTGADALIRRELVQEYPDHIVIPDSVAVRAGVDIRRRGDNSREGDVILEEGSIVTPATMSALASFGIVRPVVRSKVRVAVIIGGDELVDVSQTPRPWEIRESNGQAIQTFLNPIPWVDVICCKRVRDDLPALVAAMEDSLSACDVVLLSGGVSLGDRDFVPAAVQAVRGRVVYHGLPVRPGRPMLGALGPKGQAIIGLPGNPLSVMTAVRRFATIVLRKVAGFSLLDAPAPKIQLETPIAADAKFWLFRPVRLSEQGTAAPLPVQNSGDLVGAARSDGFVQIAPGSAAMTAPYFNWSL